MYLTEFITIVTILGVLLWIGLDATVQGINEMEQNADGALQAVSE